MARIRKPESQTNYTTVAFPRAWGDWLQTTANQRGIHTSNSKIIFSMLQVVAHNEAMMRTILESLRVVNHDK